MASVDTFDLEEYRSSTSAEKLLLAGYPKSGNTWLSVCLCRLLNLRFADHHDPVNNYYHENYYINKNNPIATPYRYLVKTHALRVNADDYAKTVYVVRDPRDVAISMFYYKYSILTDKLSRMNRFERKIALKRTIKSTCELWKLHVNMWGTNVYTVRYEDLKKDPFYTLKSLVENNLELEPDGEMIQETLEFTRLENMRENHADSGFNKFFRKGKKGDHKSHLDFLDYFLFFRSISKEMKLYGYA